MFTLQFMQIANTAYIRRKMQKLLNRMFPIAPLVIVSTFPVL